MFGSKFFKRKQYDLKEDLNGLIPLVQLELSVATQPLILVRFTVPRSKVYMDYFFEELKLVLAPKVENFATAYVITHEIGHHVQTLLGTSSKMRQMQQGKSKPEANKLSVALELQTDFLCGVWTHYM
jgi:hypothetical protein